MATLGAASRFPGLAWPEIPGGSYQARMLGAQLRLRETERLSPDELRELQSRQLSELIQHAYNSTPFYRERIDELGIAPDALAAPEAWAKLPLLARRDIQSAGEALYSNAVPRRHGRVNASITSGSCGQPVYTLGTKLTEFFWRTFTLRDHLWRRREFDQSFAAIRYTRDADAGPPHGKTSDNWGSATRRVVQTGPAHLLSVNSTVDQQATWLARIKPGYLLAYPSVLAELAKRFQRSGERIENLREIRSYGETLEPACRNLCEAVFAAPVTDVYSSQEVGYMALQCSESHTYHVQSEGVLLEVLDDAGRPCRAGEVGRVVVTSLHNFAMPLLRYDIGDFAEVGAPCACGRGLPTLARIVGRQRNMLILPDGSRRWPLFGEGGDIDALPPFRQFQVVQHSLERIEVKLVCDAPMTEEQRTKFAAYFTRTLDYPVDVEVNQVAATERGPTGKFEDFLSLVGAEEARAQPQDPASRR